LRVVVTGAGGQLGRALGAALEAHDAILLPREALDVTDPAGVEGVLRSAAPDAIVHTAAWTDVDGCELDPERARLVNTLGTQNICDAAGKAFVVVVSTDYVFDGSSSRAYVETDEPNPIQVYGTTKREAERVALASGARVAIARSAWLYGAGGTNFVASIARALRKGPVDVVTDQVGSPTSCDDLARALALLVEAQAAGVFHVVNVGSVSRFDLAQHVAACLEISKDMVRPIATAQAPVRPARRPPYAPLDGSAWREAGFDELPAWDDALRRAIPAILAAL
jgi:dTDP-4-dehydrorhamnose reductase